MAPSAMAPSTAEKRRNGRIEQFLPRNGNGRSRVGWPPVHSNASGDGRLRREAGRPDRPHDVTSSLQGHCRTTLKLRARLLAESATAVRPPVVPETSALLSTS